ncbi:RNA-directed DNA polymerase, eukaryota [Tanacetum coccineum]
MFFKVDFAKAYDSVRWDYLLDILQAFGFGPNWCRWIRGTFTSSMASILVNGSPTSEFPFCCGLKQGDPLALYLFILIMESLLSLSPCVLVDGLFKGGLVILWEMESSRLPTRVNLSRRGVLLDSHMCPLCNAAMEDVQHVFFRCDVARVVLRKICRWWDLDWQEICSFSDWDAFVLVVCEAFVGIFWKAKQRFGAGVTFLPSVMRCDFAYFVGKILGVERRGTPTSLFWYAYGSWARSVPLLLLVVMNCFGKLNGAKIERSG